MHIPVYVLTGFLDSGKTTILNSLLNRRDWRELQILVIQFETGEEDFQNRYGNCIIINFSKKVLEQYPNQIIKEIHDNLIANSIDEVWVEWNGVTPFDQLQTYLLDKSLRNLCKIEKVLHIADAKMLEKLLGKTGGALPEQISNCDFGVVRNVHSVKDYNRVSRIMRGINPGVKIYNANSYAKLYEQIYREKNHPINGFVFGILLFVSIHFIFRQFFASTFVNTVINVFLGITLQAVPFLLIGVLLSSAIQVFISEDIIQRIFPKQLGLGMLMAILGGFCLPVCDCASIPIFRSLVKKGIPIPVAVTFMTATPVINPVVILSTYYAFGGSLSIVVTRVGLGIISAILIGLTFEIWPSRKKVLTDSFDGFMCSCGCYEEMETITSQKEKISLFIRHSQAEFFGVGKYLIIGTFVSSVFQTMGAGAFVTQSGAGLGLSLLVMMGMAFVLSLCSSSDAVVARSFANTFPLGAVMGFLVFGPMMDIKNVILLSSGFSKSFIARLLLATFLVCFVVVFLIGQWV